MTDNERDVLALWQGQTAEGFRMTTEEIQMRMQKLETRLRLRTRGGYLTAAFLIVSFSVWFAVDPHPMLRTGAVAVIAAIAYLGMQMHQNRSRLASASVAAMPSIDHLRAELERQRDFHRGRRFWSRMLFLVPAGLLFFYGFATAHPEVIRIIRLEIASFIVFALAAIPLNLRMARKYQRQLDELEQQKGQA